MTAGAGAAAVPESAARRNSDALGEILWLFAHSRMHRNLRLHDLERYVFPALKHGRYRLYKRNGMPIGYVAMARLSQEVEDLWLKGGYFLQPDDWISGERRWIMQFVVPFGDVLAVRKKLWLDPELRRSPVWALRPNKAGRGLKVQQFGKYRFRDRQPLRRLVNDHGPRADASAATSAGRATVEGDPRVHEQA